jgi:hypothetical protein
MTHDNCTYIGYTVIFQGLFEMCNDYTRVIHTYHLSVLGTFKILSTTLFEYTMNLKHSYLTVV